MHLTVKIHELGKIARSCCSDAKPGVYAPYSAINP
jgi:hypothetical protein